MGLGTSILLIANRFCIELIYSECLCINIYQIDQDVSIYQIDQEYTNLEGFFSFCSQTDGIGNCCVPVQTAIGPSSSLGIVFESFLISIYQIDKT